jgi:hypothetical protein
VFEPGIILRMEYGHTFYNVFAIGDIRWIEYPTQTFRMTAENYSVGIRFQL